MTPEQQRQIREQMMKAWRSGKMKPDDAAFFKQAAPVLGIELGKHAFRGEGPRRRWTDAMWDSYDERQKTYDKAPSLEPGFAQRMMHSATFGFGDEVNAGIESLVDYAGSRIRGQPVTLQDAFDKNWAAQQASLDRAKSNVSSGGELVANVAGGLISAVPSAGGAAITSTAQAIKEGAKSGALFGGLFGLGDAEGNLAERAPSAAMGAVSGATVGAALPPLMQGVSKYAVQPLKRARRARQVRRARDARQVEREFSDAGVQPFGPAMSSSESVRGGASRLQGTVVGTPLQRAASNTLDDLQRTMERTVPPTSPDEAGRNVQAMLRQQLSGRSMSQEDVAGLTPTERQAAVGLGMRPDQFPDAPPRPPADDFYQAPGEPQPTTFSTEEIRAAMNPVEVPQPRPRPVNAEDVALPIRKINTMQRAQSDRDVALKDWRAVESDYNSAVETYNALTAGTIKGAPFSLTPDGGVKWVLPPTGPMTPKQQQQLAQLETARDTIEKLAPTYRRFEEAEQLFQNELARANEHREAYLPKLRRTEYARARQQSNEELRRNTDAEFRAARGRLQADDDIRLQHERSDTGRAQAEQRARDQAEIDADARHSELLRDHDDELQRLRAAQSEPFELGRSGETYPTEFDIAYAQARNNTPPLQRNVLGGKGEPGLTNTATLLDEIAQDARRLGQLSGYRDGKPFGDDGAIRDDIMAIVRRRAGRDIASILDGYSQRRASGRFAPNVQGIRDLRTEIGRALSDIRRSRAHDPTRKTADEVFLQRLYGAISDDFQQFVRAAPDGEIAAAQYTSIDDGYRYYAETLKRPLRNIFGDNVSPEQAIDRLTRAAQARNGNLDLLESYFKVATDARQRGAATNAILSQMMDGGPTAFVTAIENLSPAARRLMFSGESAVIGREVDRVVRVARRMAPFSRDPGDRHEQIASLARQGLFAGVAGMINLPSVITAAIGADLASRVLASRAFRQWLTRLPAAQRNGTRAQTRHSLRFFNLVREQTGVNETIMAPLISDVTAIVETGRPVTQQ